MLELVEVVTGNNCKAYAALFGLVINEKNINSKIALNALANSGILFVSIFLHPFYNTKNKGRNP